jgi:hypothetical protein
MNDIDIIVLEEFITSKMSRLEPGWLRNHLEKCGFVDSTGRLVNDDRLDRMIRLADAPAAELSSVLQLPFGNPLRSFYENVLANQNKEGMKIMELVRKHLGQRKKFETFRPKRPTPEPHEGISLGNALFDYFLASNFSEGSLSQPSHRAYPERIVWPVRLDLGADLEAGLNETERRKYQAYQILMADKPDAVKQIVNLGLAASSIPPMKAWLSRHGSPPPLLPSIFQLHLGKGKWRVNLFCSAKSNLLNSFTARFRQAATEVAIGSNLKIDGPPPGREVQITFSAARVWNIQDPDSPANQDEAIKFTKETWEVIKSVLLACGAK